jgi:hypothetical protein
MQKQGKPDTVKMEHISQLTVWSGNLLLKTHILCQPVQQDQAPQQRRVIQVLAQL